ncbi:MAG TPA: GNAT family N-acetyltransferase, partial [Micromonosporaceae bacterium]
MVELGSERLLLRDWRESDREPWAAMNADPEVRRYLGGPLSSAQAEAWMLNYQDDLDRYGYGFWALEVRDSGEFIGFTGLGRSDHGIEIAWRLARPAWGRGYATEAARVAVDHGFGELAAPEIVAVTMAQNVRSRSVMRRLGMTTDPAD